MGERTPLALIDAPASGRMAVGEAITNIAAARIGKLSDVKLSANWMAACGQPGRGRALYDAVQAVGMELCPALGITIPVGKDSHVHAHRRGRSEGARKAVTAPVSLIVTAFAPVPTCASRSRRSCASRAADTRLLLVDLGARQAPAGRLGAGAGVRAGGRPSARTWTTRALLQGFFAAMQALNAARASCWPTTTAPTAACFATLCEMAFAGHCGLRRGRWPRWAADAAARRLFNEELGAVLQVRAARPARACASVLAQHGLGALRATSIGQPDGGARRCGVRHGDAGAAGEGTRGAAPSRGRATSYEMQTLRDNPRVRRARSTPRSCDASDPGLHAEAHASTRREDVAAPFIATAARARAWRSCASRASTARSRWRRRSPRRLRRGRRAHERPARRARVARRTSRASWPAAASPTATCWARARAGPSPSCSTRARATQFAAFFARSDTFALGVCNGCQMMRSCKEHHPRRRALAALRAQRVEQFEARLSHGGGGGQPVALLPGHGRQPHPDRGRARRRPRRVRAARAGRARERAGPGRAALRRQPRAGRPRRYPVNPNGSPRRHHRPDHARRPRHHPDAAPGARVPHACRTPGTRDEWGEDGPWMRMFRNARRWVG